MPLPADPHVAFGPPRGDGANPQALNALQDNASPELAVARHYAESMGRPGKAHKAPPDALL